MVTRKKVSITFRDESLTFDIQELPPTKAMKLMVRTVKMVGEPLLHLLAGAKKDVKDVLPNIAGLLRDGLDENEFDALVKEFMNCAFINGQPVAPQFEVVFMGKLPVVFKLLVEIIKHNYADFLSEFVSEKNQDALTKVQ